jgi:hypothetical protein
MINASGKKNSLRKKSRPWQWLVDNLFRLYNPMRPFFDKTRRPSEIEPT